jgi:hypothetical protein
MRFVLVDRSANGGRRGPATIRARRAKAREARRHLFDELGGGGGLAARRLERGRRRGARPLRLGGMRRLGRCRFAARADRALEPIGGGAAALDHVAEVIAQGLRVLKLLLERTADVVGGGAQARNSRLGARRGLGELPDERLERPLVGAQRAQLPIQHYRVTYCY